MEYLILQEKHTLRVRKEHIMSKDGIKLSKKYGVNPTIPICFWCGEHKNEIALCGHIGNYRKGEDFEAPKNCILDYEPCDKCKEIWDKGVVLIEVDTKPQAEGQLPIQDPYYPTGRYAVMEKSSAEKTFKPEVLEKGLLLVPPEVFEQIVPQEDKDTKDNE